MKNTLYMHQINPMRGKKISLVFFLLLFVFFIFGKNHSAISYTLLQTQSFELNFTVGIDRLSRLMSVFILLISSLIYLYALDYLKSESRQGMFLFQFTLVVLSSLLLATARNLVTAFIAWQFISISLYFLLNFYHDDLNANRSAKKKFVINRLGDCTFLTAIMMSLQHHGTTLFSQIQHCPHGHVVAALLFISVLTKCAQFPFHIWLLDTMEAPTPVSALMHAGIINSGGIIFTRVSPLIIHNKPLLIAIMIMSLLTILLTGFWKKKQPDVKKQLAYSTSSQMGYMLLQCSVGAFASAVFHLIMHGFFKATLFLNSGTALEEQAILKKTPTLFSQITVAVITVGVLAVCYGYGRYISLSLPAVVAVFIILTIFTSVKQILKEETPFQWLLILVLLIFTMIYLTMLHAMEVYLSQYRLYNAIVSVNIQIIGVAALGLCWLILNSLKKTTAFSQDFTEVALRKYVLYPIRAIGEKISIRFDNKRYIATAIAIIMLALIGISFIDVSAIPLSDPTSKLIVFMLLAINIVLLLAANRAHGLVKLVTLLILYHMVFIGYALVHESLQLNSIIIFTIVNLTPVLIFLGLIARKDQQYPKYMLTFSLLALIGVPGSASFVYEVVLLNAMYHLGTLFLVLYLSGIILLSLSIMHALQLYSFGAKKRINQKPKTAFYAKIAFLVIMTLNVVLGVHPSLLLSLV